MKAARSASPEDLSIHLELIHVAYPLRPEAVQELRRDYAAMPDSPLVECLRAYVGVTPDNRAGAAESLLALERRYPRHACPVVLLSQILGELRPQRNWAERRLAYSDRAVELAPGWLDAWIVRAGALAGAGRYAEAERVFVEASARLKHPVWSIPLQMRRAGVLLQSGDTVRAAALSRAVARAVERDGRPGVRFRYLRELDVLTTVPRMQLGSLDDVLRAQAELARAHGSRLDEWQARYSLGMSLTNRGEPLAAIRELDRALLVADSARIPARQIRTLYKRARALGRAGRRAEAERDLLRAAGLVPLVESPYVEAETWHGLLHLYDEDGRVVEALRASDRFLAAARRMPHSPLRMTAWLDAGELLWKAGQHAAANEAFRGMVSVVDAYDEYHAYAGQYFERRGDLERARRYFRRGAMSEAPSADGVRSLCWAGLARVHMALGDRDSAEAAARRHDAEITSGTGVPVLPEILARQGRADEAATEAGVWARKRMNAGAVEAAAVAHVAWADFLLLAGRADEALQAAGRADSLARFVDKQSVVARAARLRALAHAASGERAEALALMEEAASAALRFGDAEAILEVHVDLAVLTAASGRAREALDALEIAAEQVDDVTGSFASDLDRVRYRSLHMAPFDAALRLFLSDPALAGDAERALAWARRRKAAALALSLGPVAPGSAGPPGPPAPGSTRVRLPSGTTVLDYHVLDPEVLVLVLAGDDSPSIVRLPIEADSLERLVETVRSPFESIVAGRLDLARAPPPGEAARALHAAVVEPVAPLFDGSRVLLISPDGPLHGVSFAGLPVASYAVGSERASPEIRYLIEDAEIAYVPSLDFLPGPGDEHPAGFRDSGSGSRATLAIAAGEAPGADREIAGIERTWQGTVRRLGDGRTGETDLVAAAGRPTILHVVAHAIVDDTDPRASYIALAGDSLADGKLHAVEIEAQDWRGTFVVLSACESLGGPRFRGEGLLGLGRAFLVAGAPAVVATQWPIGPNAADLAQAFYRRLTVGEAPGAALRGAQLELLGTADRSHPFFWAAFALYLSPGSRIAS